MAIFRVEKNSNYTVMSNYHLRDKQLSLKAKGLLSQMLSLPEEWDYTLAGLALINKEQVDAIRTAIKELERAGYIFRQRTRTPDGVFTGIEYVIRELPESSQEPDKKPLLENPIVDEEEVTEPLLENPIVDETGAPEPMLDFPILDNPTLEEPILAEPMLENPTQLNKDISNKDLSSKDLSLPPSPSPQRLPRTRRRKGREAITEQAMAEQRDEIRRNIEYEKLLEDLPDDQELIDELVEIMTETCCTSKDKLRVGGVPYTAGVVCAKMRSLQRDHIAFVASCMRENTTRIVNMRQYLLTALFNAPSTIQNYYSARVNADRARNT